MTSPSLFSALAAAALSALISSAASAAPISSFSDNFNADGPVGLNFNSFINWNVGPGTVDLISQGQFALSCAGGSGICVDMDGTSAAAGTMTTKDQFIPGSYVLSFDLSGNQRGGTDTMTVSLGSYSEVFVLPFSAPYQTIVRNVSVLALSSLIFAHAGGDQFGMMLDNVSVSAAPVTGETPLPAALPLFAGGLGLVGLLARRRKRKLQAAA